MLLVPPMVWSTTQAEPVYIVNAVEFDGSTAYLSKNSTIYNATSQVGAMSVWLRLDSGGGNYPIIHASGYFDYDLSISYYFGRIQFWVYALEGTRLVVLSNTVTLPTGWFNLLVSWDMTADVSHRVQFYINDADAFGFEQQPLFGSFTLPAMPTWHVGKTSWGADKLNGGMSELWMALGTKIDFSDEASRRKFISASGKPVYLGDNGELPTGSAPALYLNNPYTGFGTNKGAGGNFTVNGTLSASPTSPSD